MSAIGPGVRWFLVGAALAFWSASRTSVGLDYKSDAQPAVDALASGHFVRALENPPLMGPVSIVIRAPVVALVNAFGADDVMRYRAGSFVCLLGVAILAGVIGGDLARRRRPVVVQATAVALLMLAGPILSALKLGHPEEPLLGALVVGVVLAGARGRLVLALTLLALAMATKPNAILGVAPLIAVRPGWRRVVRELWAPISGFALLLALAALSVRERVMTAVQTGTSVRFASWWWWMSSRRQVTVFDGVAERSVELRHLSPVIGRWAHVAIALLVVPAALFHVRFGRRTLRDALGLLALLMLARSILDPVNNIYYHVPFVIALVCWECASRERLPVASLAAVAGLWLVLDWLPRERSLDVANVAYVMLSAAYGGGLTLSLYGHLRKAGGALPSRSAA